jgi:type IV secretory pathway VirB3-like protein
MERHAVILGLSRQAKLLGLPLPYTMAVGALIMLPFIWVKTALWLLTAPVWYGLARLITSANPNGHKAVAVVFRKTPPALSRRRRREGRRYV